MTRKFEKRPRIVHVYKNGWTHRLPFFCFPVNVQLSGKMIGGQQLRAGIYDLIQKVRGKGKAPITSNLPSENFALGRGSKRLAG